MNVSTQKIKSKEGVIILERVHKAVQFVVVTFEVAIPCVMFSGFVYYLGYITNFGLDTRLVPRGLGDMDLILTRLFLLQYFNGD